MTTTTAPLLAGSLLHYQTKVLPSLKKQMGYSSIMQVPRLEKIVLNMGLGEAKNNRAVLEEGLKALGLIAGQRAVLTKAKNSIAGFKIREGMPIGAKVTLRKKRMYDFLIRLIHVTLPRIKDFHGISFRAFDGRGNYTLGLREASVFPELMRSHSELVRGVGLVFATSAKNDLEAEALLRALGLPLQKRK